MSGVLEEGDGFGFDAGLLDGQFAQLSAAVQWGDSGCEAGDGEVQDSGEEAGDSGE